MTSGTRGATRFGGWGSPPRSQGQARRRRATAAMMGLLVCACIAAGVAFATLGGGPGRPRVSKGASPDLASAQTTVDTMSAIVAVSAADRTRVINVIDAVQSCALTASSGQSTLESVINDRRTGVAQLQHLAAIRTPGISSSMINDLVTTLNASISDDESYMSWMGDVAGGRSACGGNPMSDPNFAAAKAESDRTNLDKETFVEEWNPLAQSYGKPTYRSGDF